MTITEMKVANRNVGHYWFDKDTMKFWNSKVVSSLYEAHEAVYFVSSERQRETWPAMFTVRKFNKVTSHVETVGRFQQYESIDKARSAAKRAALKNERKDENEA